MEGYSNEANELFIKNRSRGIEMGSWDIYEKGGEKEKIKETHILSVDLIDIFHIPGQENFNKLLF
jgi:hypothetical protein